MSPGLSNLFEKAKPIIDSAAIPCPLGLNNFSVYQVQLRKLTFENKHKLSIILQTQEYMFLAFVTISK